MRHLTYITLIMAILALGCTLAVPSIVLAECRIVSVQKPDGTWTTCQICDHIVVCD